MGHSQTSQRAQIPQQASAPSSAPMVAQARGNGAAVSELEVVEEGVGLLPATLESAAGDQAPPSEPADPPGPPAAGGPPSAPPPPSGATAPASPSAPPDAPAMATKVGLNLTAWRFEKGVKDLPEVASVQAGVIRFRDASPDPLIVAEEVVHAAQMTLGQGTASVSAPMDVAEAEAGMLARALVRGEAVGPPEQRATARRMRNNGPELQRRLDAIDTLAGVAVADLAPELEMSDWNPMSMGQDMRVRARIARYFGDVRGLLADGPREAFNWLLDQARETLQQRWYRDRGSVLTDKIAEELSGDDARDVQRWITVRGHARPAPSHAGGSTEQSGSENPATRGSEAAPDAAQAEAQSDSQAAPAPEAEEAARRRRGQEEGMLRRTLDGYITRVVQQLVAEFDATWTEDSTILEYLRTYRTNVTGALGDHEGHTGSITLDSELHRMRDTFGSRGHSLRSRIVATMSGGDRDTALDLAGLAGGGGDVVRRSGGGADTQVDIPEHVTGALDLLQEAIAAIHDHGDDVAEVRQRYQTVFGYATGGSHDVVRMWFRQHHAIQLDQALRRAAGDRADLLGQMLEACHLQGAAVLQEGREGTDRDAVIAQLAGPVQSLHNLLEGMIAAPDDEKLACVGAIDSSFASLVLVANRGGVGRGEARGVAIEAYHHETGHTFRAQLLLAAGHSSRARTALQRRLGVDFGPTEGSEPTTEVLDGQLRRLSRRMYTAVVALRNASLTALRCCAAVEDLWDEVLAAGQGANQGGQATRRMFYAVYNEQSHLSFATHLRQATEGNGMLIDRLEEHLGIEIGEATHGGYDQALQELHDLFAQTIVRDSQVNAQITTLMAAARRRDLTPEQVVHEYEQRFHEGLADQVRARVMDLERRNRALRAIGAQEDVAAELSEDLEATAGNDATPEHRASLRRLGGQVAEAARDLHAACRASDPVEARSVVSEVSDHWLLAYGDPMDREALRRALERPYAAQGGDLVRDLHRADAQEAARLLAIDLETELGQRAAEQQGVDLSVGGDTSEGRYRAVVQRRLGALWTAIQDLGIPAVRRTHPEAAVRRAWTAALRGEPDEQTRRTILLSTYEETYTLTIPHHIELSTNDAPTLRAGLATDLGLDLGTTQQAVEASAATAAEGLQSETATLAGSLHAAINQRDLDEVTRLMLGRTSAQKQAIREAHDQLYPNAPLRHQITSVYFTQPSQRTMMLSAVGLAGAHTARAEVLAHARSRDYAGVVRAIRWLEDDQREALRNDGEVNAALRGLSDQEFHNVREILAGNDSISAGVRTESEVEVAGIGVALPWGADSGDVQNDLESRARTAHARITREVEREGGDALEPSERARRVRMRMRAWGAEQGAEPGNIDALCTALDASEQSRGDATLRSNGSLSTADSILRDPSGDDLISNLEGLDEDERARLARDEAFMGRLRDENTPERYAQASALLRGDRAESAALAEARGDLATRTDEVAQMNDQQLQAWLDTRQDGQRGRMDAQASTLLAIEDEEERATARRVFQHRWRILGAARSGREAVSNTLERALDCHNDTEIPRRDRSRLQTEINVELIRIWPHSIMNATVIVHDLVGREPGAVQALTRYTLHGANNVGTLTHTLENADDAHVARHWSNLIEAGLDGRTFATVLGYWVDMGCQGTCAEYEDFCNFTFDIAAGFERTLRDEDGIEMTTDAERVEWVNSVRGRIRRLSNDTVWDLMREAVPRLPESVREQMNDRARQMRTHEAEDASTYELDQGQDSAVDGFIYEDDRQRSSSLRMFQAYDAALADHEATEDELANVEGLRAINSEARAEYRQARDEITDTCKTVGVAITTIVAGVLTGGMGSVVAAGMITGASTATVTALIEEACRGNDYEFVRTGLPDIVKSAVIDGFTAAVGQWGGQAAAAFAAEGTYARRLVLWRQALANTRNPAWQIADAALTGAGSAGGDLAQDMLEQLGNNVWEHGTIRGVHESLGHLRSELNGHVQREFLVTFLSEIWDHGSSHIPFERVRDLLGSAPGEAVRDNVIEEAADSITDRDDHQVDVGGDVLGMARARLNRAATSVTPGAADHYIAGTEYRQVGHDVLRDWPDWVPRDRYDALLEDTVRRHGFEGGRQVVTATVRARIERIERAYTRSGAATMGEAERRRYLTWALESPDAVEDRLEMGDTAGVRTAHARE